MIQLFPQFRFIDDIGEAHIFGAVGKREAHMHPVMFTLDQLRHQKFIKIIVHQAADDGVHAKIMIILAGREIHEHFRQDLGQEVA